MNNARTSALKETEASRHKEFIEGVDLMRNFRSQFRALSDERTLLILREFDDVMFSWLHLRCLGLKWDGRTTRNPVRMEWLLSAPQGFRVWFLLGLTDSDGDVHFEDKEVKITTVPNTHIVKSLYESLEIHAREQFSKGYGSVVISGRDAARIRIFNPEVLTHRRRLLEKLDGARTFQRHWPNWLET